MLAGKKILVGITASIAAYKTANLVRLLVQKGAEVKVVMTPAATEFVTPLTLSTLSQNPVLYKIADEATWANHVMLGRWADVFLIAPLSCNTLAKMAYGLCDNLLMATYLSATCPVIAAPAMDEDMWEHASTRSNIETVRSHGVHVLDVGYGFLASGLTGKGRMAEPEELAEHLVSFLNPAKPLEGKKVLITAGPTYEAIDPVRFISNHSTGKMGYALAEELAIRGASVVLVSGPVQLEPPKNVEVKRVTSAAEMYSACMDVSDTYHLAIMAAAVADYTPVNKAEEKIKKGTPDFELKLKKTQDILSALGHKKKSGQYLVGFALETNDERSFALKKLKEKKADLIILNSLRDESAGFGHDTNKVTLFFASGNEKELGLRSKKQLAKDIIDSISQLI